MAYSRTVERKVLTMKVSKKKDKSMVQTKKALQKAL